MKIKISETLTIILVEVRANVYGIMLEFGGIEKVRAGELSYTSGSALLTLHNLVPGFAHSLSLYLSVRILEHKDSGEIAYQVGRKLIVNGREHDDPTLAVGWRQVPLPDADVNDLRAAYTWLMVEEGVPEPREISKV